MTGVTRRDLLLAGGLSLAGALFPALARPRPGQFTVRMVTSEGDGRVLFRPAGLRIPAGATVTWVLDAGVHTVTAYHPDNGSRAARIPPGAEPWDSGYLMNPGDSFSRTLAEPGVYDYFCRPHERAGMVGRIVVLSFDGPEPGDDGLPDAARRALPPVSRILREGRVPAWPSPG